MPINDRTDSLAEALGQRLRRHQWRCAVAESCTGGLLAAAITDIAGSSAWFERGFVTYTNQSKIDMLMVPSEILLSCGAVSEETVCAMAKGASVMAKVPVSVAISGIAGPTGGSVEKPVGTVWIAWVVGARPIHAMHYLFEGTRKEVRQQAVHAALTGLIEALDQ